MGRQPVRVLSQQLRAVFERELDSLEAAFDVRGDGGEIASTHAGRHVHPTRGHISMDFGRRGSDAHIRDILQGHVSA